MLDTEYFMILFVFVLTLLTIFFILYHIKHQKNFSEERINEFKTLIEENDHIRPRIPEYLLNKIDMFLKYIEERADYTIFDIERKVGIDLETLEKKILKIKNGKTTNEEEVRNKERGMDLLDLKKEVYKQLATSLLGVLSLVVDKKVFSKSVYFVVEPKGGTFLMMKVNETLNLGEDEKAVFTLVKEGVTASETKEIIIEGNIKQIGYEDEETWKRALELFKKKSPFLANIDILGKKKEYILLYLYPVMITYNSIAGEREGKQPVVMVKKGENVWK